MPDRYEMRQGADGLWEVVDEVTGETPKLPGVPLSGLDLDAAMGALDVLRHDVVGPNGEGSSRTDADTS